MNVKSGLNFGAFVFAAISCAAFGCRRSDGAIVLARTQSKAVMDSLHESDAEKFFSSKYFPPESTRQLLGALNTRCDPQSRVGGFVNEAHGLNLNGPDKVSFVYEYYYKCDSLRFVLTYLIGDTSAELYQFDIESMAKHNPLRDLN